MKISSRDEGFVRILGRFDKKDDGVTLNWTGSGLETMVKGSYLEVEIEAEYHTMRPYVSFIVDGLTAQTFAPLPGRHTYTAFFHLNPEKAHPIRVILETQLFMGDAKAVIHSLNTDGEFIKPKDKRIKIEFVGDSITSGEGCRGPVDFQEWVPMMFSASENYANYASQALNAQYQAVSISGWGVKCAWNNDPACRIPRIYEEIAADGKPYDFTFDPDYVVVALGTNDYNALYQPEYVHPETGEVSRFDQEQIPDFLDRAKDFIGLIHKRNPRAKIVWISFFENTPLTDALDSAAEAARREGIPALHASVLNLKKLIRGGMGSRQHPGVVAHKRIARELVKLIKKA